MAFFQQYDSWCWLHRHIDVVIESISQWRRKTTTKTNRFNKLLTYFTHWKIQLVPSCCFSLLATPTELGWGHWDGGTGMAAPTIGMAAPAIAGTGMIALGWRHRNWDGGTSNCDQKRRNQRCKQPNVSKPCQTLFNDFYFGVDSG